MATPRHCNVLIGGEKACLLHSTHGSPDFVGVFRRIGIAKAKHFEDILWHF